MLNISLFTIRQYQIGNRCKSQKGTAFYTDCNRVFINLLYIIIQYNVNYFTAGTKKRRDSMISSDSFQD